MYVKKILLVERDGQFKSDTQSLEDFVHFKVSESMAPHNPPCSTILDHIKQGTIPALQYGGDSTPHRHTPCMA